MEKKKIVIIICLLMTAISILMIIVQTKRNKEKDEFANEAIKTTATVENITSKKAIKWVRRRSRNKLRIVNTYTAFVSYEVDGTVYNTVKVKGTYDMKIGSQIDVYYLPDKPSVAKSSADLTKENTPVLYFVAFLGILLAYGVYSDQIQLKHS